MEYGSDEWITFSLALEEERISYSKMQKALSDEELNFSKFAQGKKELKLKVEQLDAMREQRDKLFFNAGRYAGGARDDVATQANKIIDYLLEGEE